MDTQFKFDKPKTEQLNVRVTPEMLARINAIALTNKVDKTEVVRGLLDVALAIYNEKYKV